MSRLAQAVQCWLLIADRVCGGASSTSYGGTTGPPYIEFFSMKMGIRFVDIEIRRHPLFVLSSLFMVHIRPFFLHLSYNAILPYSPQRRLFYTSHQYSATEPRRDPEEFYGGKNLVFRRTKLLVLFGSVRALLVHGFTTLEVASALSYH